MLRPQLIIGYVLLVLAALLLTFNDPDVFYYFPVLVFDAGRLPAKATVAVPVGFLNFKVVPHPKNDQPQWPTAVSWRLTENDKTVLFAGETNLSRAPDVGWRRPTAVRELSFSDGVWFSNKDVNPKQVYSLTVLSAQSATGVRAEQFVIDMYYVAPLRIYDRLTCIGRCVRRRDPPTVRRANYGNNILDANEHVPLL